MSSLKNAFGSLSCDIVSRIESGDSLQTIFLKEKQVFPHIIPAQPATARKSRSTGVLFGRATPEYVKFNRSVFYRLSDVLEWLSEVDTFSSTAHHTASNI